MSRDLKELRDEALKTPGIRVFCRGRWKSKCTGPELGECIASSSVKKGTSVGEAER